MKTVISLPVHEALDTVINQIQNYQHFIPEVIIVIHASSFFEWDDLPEKIELQKMDNILINPDRFPTQRGNGLLVDVHNSNFKFALQNIGFDYFAMHSSNDMFVKKGLENYITNYEAGFAQYKLSSIMDFVSKDPILSKKLKAKSNAFDMDLTKHHPAEKDPCLTEIVKYFNIQEILGSQIEGTFYHTEIFKEIVKEIEKFYTFKDKRIPAYSREEFYYPTVASKIVNNIGSLYTFFNWKEPIDIDLIENIRANNQYNYNSTIYDMTNIFNVKRILRNTDDPIRKYITDLSH